MAYIRTCVQIVGEIRRPVRNNCPSSLIIDFLARALKLSTTALTIMELALHRVCSLCKMMDVIWQRGM